MTEEIIIDGINVRDCNRCNPFHYDRGASEYPICLTSLEQWGGTEHYCNQRPNCYYKQLKRLEQENKELKEKYTHVLELAKTNADSNEYCLQELEKENETWQKTCEVLKEQAQLDGECIDKLIEARDMYAKALEEIRSIAQDAIDRKFASNSLDYSEGQECIGYYVMEKINEVLGND